LLFAGIEYARSAIESIVFPDEIARSLAVAEMKIRLPDALHARLKELARSRGLSANKLMEELATVALVQQDTAARFAMRAQRGNVARGLAILDELDAQFANAA
jgi:predicted transcriptional regulator